MTAKRWLAPVYLVGSLSLLLFGWALLVWNVIAIVENSQEGVWLPLTPPGHINTAFHSVGLNVDRYSSTLEVTRWASISEWDEERFDWQRYPLRDQRLAGFRIIRGVATEAAIGGVNAKGVAHGFGLPTIPTAIFLMSPFGHMLYRQMKAERRSRTQRCPSCGYDLRATPDRCPECSTPVKSDVALASRSCRDGQDGYATKTRSAMACQMAYDDVV